MPLKKDGEQLCKVSDVVRILLQCCRFSLSKQSTFDSKSITPWLLSFLKILNKNCYHTAAVSSREECISLTPEIQGLASILFRKPGSNTN